jgi:hypothetical protein
VLFEIFDDIVALVERLLALMVDEERNLIVTAEFDEFGTSLLVPYLASVETGIVDSIGDAEFGERLADRFRVLTAFGLVEF